MNRRAVALFGAVGLLPLTLVAAPTAQADPGERTYRVTIVNLTSGQAFTPVVAATHNRRTDVFEVGEPASLGVQQIAENGDLAPLVDALSTDTDVSDLVVGQAPLVPEARVGPTGFPNATTFMISTDARADRLSYVAMLICTNDGFSGLDSVRLPVKKDRPETFLTNGYDAGTEINTEQFADIVPPCQGLIGAISPNGTPGTGTTNPALAEGGVITHHPNVVGTDDGLDPAVHGWEDPVLQVTVTRVS